MVMPMIVVVRVGLLLAAPGAPQHPRGDAEDQHRRSHLEIRLGGFRVPVLAEIHAQQRHRPHHRRVRQRRRQAQQYRLADGAANGDDEGGHHGLGVAGFQPVQRAEQDGAGDEQPRVALLEQGRKLGHGEALRIRGIW